MKHLRAMFFKAFYLEIATFFFFFLPKCQKICIYWFTLVVLMEIHSHSVTLKEFFFKINWVWRKPQSSVRSQVNTSLGLADIKMRHSSAPEFRGAHQSEHPSSLRPVDFVVSIKPRACF